MEDKIAQLKIKERKENAKREFEQLIKDYILPLFDVHSIMTCEIKSVKNKHLISIKKEQGKTYAYF